LARQKAEKVSEEERLAVMSAKYIALLFSRIFRKAKKPQSRAKFALGFFALVFSIIASSQIIPHSFWKSPSAVHWFTTSTTYYTQTATAWSQPLIAIGGSGSYTFTLPTNPGGNSAINGSGVVSFTPAAPGRYSFVARVTDTANSAHDDLSFTLDATPSAFACGRARQAPRGPPPATGYTAAAAPPPAPVMLRFFRSHQTCP
jgi:hypothetical protein